MLVQARRERLRGRSGVLHALPFEQRWHLRFVSGRPPKFSHKFERQRGLWIALLCGAQDIRLVAYRHWRHVVSGAAQPVGDSLRGVNDFLVGHQVTRFALVELLYDVVQPAAPELDWEAYHPRRCQMRRCSYLYTPCQVVKVTWIA